MDNISSLGLKLKSVDIEKVLFKYFLISMNIYYVLSYSSIPGNGIKIINIILNVIAGILLVHKNLFLLRKYSLWKIVISLLLLFSCSLSLYISKVPALFKVALFFLIIDNESYEETFEYMWKSLLIGLFIVVTSSIIGITPITSGIKTKDAFSLGFINPNTPPVILFAIICFYNLEKNEISFKMLIFELLICITTFFIFKSRSFLNVTLIYIALIFIDKLLSKIIKINFIGFLSKYSFLLIMFVSLIVASFYSNNVTWNKLNILLSYRPYIWNSYIRHYPITLFGNILNTDLYASLDNAFLQLLLKYGLFGLISYSLFFYISARFSLKNDMKILSITIIAYSLYFFNEFGPAIINVCAPLLFSLIVIGNGLEVNKDE